MAKKPGKRSSDAEVKKLTATVEKLSGRLKEAEADTAKWKAEAKRSQAETATLAKQVKKLRKAKARAKVKAVEPKAASNAASDGPTPDESWTVAQLRAAARDAGITGYSRLTKAALLEALK